MKLTFHSLIDVITNSSTVTYVMAKNKSVEVVKELVNEILKLSDKDTKLTVDDLFDISIYDPEPDEDGGNVYIHVVPKIKLAERAAQILSALEKLFDYESSYDG